MNIESIVIDQEGDYIANLKRAYAIKDNYSKLIRYSELIDDIDKITGPLTSILEYSGFGTDAYGLGQLIKLTELVIKIPFMAYYASKTKDVKGTLKFFSIEAGIYVMPFGDVFDIYNLYTKTVDAYITKEILNDNF